MRIKAQMEEVHCRCIVRFLGNIKKSTIAQEIVRSHSSRPIKELMTLIVSCNGIYPTLEVRIKAYRFIYMTLSIDYRRVVQRYDGGSRCLDSTRRSPAWSPGRPVRPSTFLVRTTITVDLMTLDLDRSLQHIFLIYTIARRSYE
jgi:hypothetical protein